MRDLVVRVLVAFSVYLPLFLIGGCGMPVGTVDSATVPASEPTAVPTIDIRNQIRVEQAVRDVVVPNTMALSEEMNGYIAQTLSYLGFVQLWYVRYELVDWQTEQMDSGDYLVSVLVEASEECSATNTSTCSEQKQLALPPGSSLEIKGCEEPARFQVLLGEPMTVVPMNRCAENIYYSTAQ